MREGEILKEAITFSDYTIEDILDLTGLTRGQLYHLYTKEIILPKYKKQIDKLKLKINWHKKEKVDFRDKQIELLEDKVATLTKLNNRLMSLLNPK
jgi:hypothetical protein